MSTLSFKRRQYESDLVEMFREKLDSFTISDYHGLNSPGLTCYLNSVLQVFFMTEDFREAVKRCCSKDSASIDPQLEGLFADLQKSTAKTHNVIEKLGIKNVYEQRDAAEYFERILCLTSPEAAKIFKGELNHKTTCLKCKENNDSRGSFWILPLAVEDLRRQTYSVEKGLKAFFKGEKVCKDNKMYCNRCNEKRDADFGCEITQNPEILTLLLKRFSFDYKRRCYVKLHCNVDVPQTLHTENCKYDLYALVNHFGDLTGGHYTAQIKSFETHMWYHFNDNIVDRVEPPLFGAGNNSLRSCTAYLLMYRKVSSHPGKTDEGDQEALCAHSHVDAEGRHNETERGQALLPHPQLKDESCNGGGNSNDGTVWKKQTGELEKQLNQREACARPHEEMLQTDTGGHGDSCEPSLRTEKLHFAKLQKDVNDCSLASKRVKPADVVKNKREAVAEVRIEGNSAKQKREAGGNANTFHVSSDDCSTLLTGHTQSQFSMHEPNLCTKSNGSKRDEERMQHVAITQTVKTGLTTARLRRKAAESRDKEPWR